MSKDKDLELKKIEIEKAKVIEGLIRTIVISILTVGAGEGTLIFKLLNEKVQLNILVYKYMLIILTAVLILLIVLIIYLTKKFNNHWRN
ncbi:hypothetical protein [Hydrogenivirga sp. 128-5-R1-1]|uniref:hypothetical protein n=1 Tax=Hydrogenivirga sp. 128-5-R1-1 TaxID=392423 RepID=UPI00015F1D4B|nr:hypothetical protein [Hydrogenivirga sp. 128-5-R1-1]EDP74049.1 methionyl-tRNA formyltransferase [Hydrogenivirga sp. 128-5-R1-1]